MFGVRARPSCVLIAALLAGCGPERRSSGEDGEASTSAASMTSTGEDVPHPYEECNQACDGDLFGCSYCSALGCADPELSGPFEVCNAVCTDVSDCPSPPIDGEVLCEYGGCYLGCTSNPCPEGQTCVHFVMPSDAPVCMYVG